MNEVRLALGTAQFGLPYGVTNVGGRVTPQEITAILNEARASGIDMLDTAAVYGNSEQVLGEAGVEWFQVVSKLPPMPETVHDVKPWVEEHVHASLQKLGVSKLKALLLHKPAQLLEKRGAEIVTALSAVKKAGLTEKVGYSMYDPTEWSRYRKLMKPDVVQVPVNSIDQRWKVSGALQEMAEVGIEIHVRSVFMQGLLLAPPKAAENYFLPWAHVFETWRKHVQQSGRSAAACALAFARSVPGVHRLVVGVTTVTELKELVNNFAVEPTDLAPILENYDTDLIRPERWPLACT